MLGRLRGPRGAWLLAWAAVPVAAGLLPGSYLATVGAQPLPVRLLTGLVYGYAVVLAFWAIGKFTREGTTVERSVDQLAAGPGQAATPVFLGMASTKGPLALTLVFAAVTVWRPAMLGDLGVALLWLPVTLLVNLPLLTAVWIYLALLLGLNRLGRRSLSLTAFPEDLSLGLGEVGRLAFTAFWIYGAGFAPVLLVNFAYPLRLLLTLGLFPLGCWSSSPACRACAGSCWPPAATTWSGPASCTPAPTSRSGPARRRPWASRPSRSRRPR
jgi:hypothetical protein